MGSQLFTFHSDPRQLARFAVSVKPPAAGSAHGFKLHKASVFVCTRREIFGLTGLSPPHKTFGFGLHKDPFSACVPFICTFAHSVIGIGITRTSEGREGFSCIVGLVAA